MTYFISFYSRQPLHNLEGPVPSTQIESNGFLWVLQLLGSNVKLNVQIPSTTVF